MFEIQKSCQKCTFGPVKKEKFSQCLFSSDPIKFYVTIRGHYATMS